MCILKSSKGDGTTSIGKRPMVVQGAIWHFESNQKPPNTNPLHVGLKMLPDSLDPLPEDAGTDL